MKLQKKYSEVLIFASDIVLGGENLEEVNNCLNKW